MAYLAWWFTLCCLIAFCMALRKNNHLREEHHREVTRLRNEIRGVEGERDLARRHVEVWSNAAMDAGVHVIPDLETLPEPVQAPARKRTRKKKVNVNEQDASPYGERTGVRKIKVGGKSNG